MLRPLTDVARELGIPERSLRSALKHNLVWGQRINGIAYVEMADAHEWNNHRNKKRGARIWR